MFQTFVGFPIIVEARFIDFRLGCAVWSMCNLEIIGGVVGLDGRQRRSSRQLIHSYFFRSRNLATTFRCGL